MEPKFQTSFIPKKPIVTSPGSSITVIRSTNLLSVISTVLFIITVLVAGGLLGYKYLLTSQIAEADQSIASARAAFEPETIQKLVDANARILASKGLLEQHVVVSNLLLLFQELTLKKMRFVEFDYKSNNGMPMLTIRGEVQTYNALAQQQQIFSKSEYIKDPVFENFNLEDNGYISVDFRATVDPTLLSYKKAVDSMPLQ